MPHKRINIRNLNPCQIKSYRRAVAALRKDGTVYRDNFFLWHHDMHSQGIHTGELFLPWHRGFLNSFEDEIVARGSQIGVPYWDWHGWNGDVSGIPEQFLVNHVGGDCAEVGAVHGNPLGIAREQQGTCSGPAIPSADGWSAIVSSLTQFAELGGGEPGHYGKLQEIHNRIHCACGSTMNELSKSVNDPIFWSVHSNVDRLWREAQRMHSRFSPPRALMQRSLPPLPPGGQPVLVQEVEDVSASRYEYIERSLSAPIQASGSAAFVNLPEVPELQSAAFRALRITVRGVTIDSDLKELNFASSSETVLSIPLLASTMESGHKHHGHQALQEVSLLLSISEVMGKNGKLSLNQRLDLTPNRLDDKSPGSLQIAGDARVIVDVLV